MSRFSIQGGSVGGGGSSDGSGIGSVIASGSQIYPSDLTIIGAGVVEASVAGSTLTISGIQTAGAATSHGTLSDLGADDHGQYVLVDGDRSSNTGVTAVSGSYKAVSGIFNEQVTISGINVGDYLSVAAGADGSGIGSVIASGNQIYPTDLTFYGSGSVVVATGDANSIIISGGGGGVSDHGALAGLADDDHTQYLLVDGSRNASSLTIDTTLGVSGATTLNGNLEPLTDDSILLGASNKRWAEVQAMAISGATNIGAGTQMWISGIPVGDYLGQGGGNPVDSRAATGNISPDTDEAYVMGTSALKWDNVYSASGNFPSGIMIAATDQTSSGFLITINSDGQLQADGPFAI